MLLVGCFVPFFSLSFYLGFCQRSVIDIVCIPLLSARELGHLQNFQKGEGLDRISIFTEGLLEKRG